jgi:hypothetical protein
MTDNDTNRIEIMLARVEERQKADQESAQHWRANIKQVMGEIVPRREINSMHKVLSDKIDDNNEAIIIRVVKLEDAMETARDIARQAAIRSGGIGAGIGGGIMAVVFAAAKKLGFV